MKSLSVMRQAKHVGEVSHTAAVGTAAGDTSDLSKVSVQMCLQLIALSLY